MLIIKGGHKTGSTYGEIGGVGVGGYHLDFLLLSAKQRYC